MKEGRSSPSVLRHVARSYGTLPGVWVGFFASAAAYVLLYGALAVAVAEFLLAALTQTTGEPGALALKILFVLSVSGTLALVGNYAFVRSTDLRYASLVGQYYSSVAFSNLGKLQAERMDNVKNLFREHMDGTIGILRLCRDDVLRIVLACLVPALFLATYDLLVGILVAAVAGLQAWVALAASKRVATLRKRALIIYHRLTVRMFDALRNSALLRIADATSTKRSELERLASAEASVFWDRHRSFFLFEYAKTLLTATCFALVFWLTSMRYTASPEAAYLVILSAMYLLQAMQSASSSADVAPRLQEKWSNVAESLAMLQRLADAGGQEPSGKAADRTGREDEAILLKDLTFAYSTDQGQVEVFRDLFLRVPTGAHVAIIGANGSGKSTLLRIILGLESPKTGEVWVAGREIRSLTDLARAKLVSWLPPAGPVIDGTVEENLRLFDPHASDEAVRRALSATGLSESLAKLPSGLSGSVGEGGTALSDGQKARLALSRCLLRKSELYLLDEPTAAIDPDSATHILSAVLDMLKGRTVVAVIHSDEVLKQFPYVLECVGSSLKWIRRPYGDQVDA